jgi:hypothetical protein
MTALVVTAVVVGLVWVLVIAVRASAERARAAEAEREARHRAYLQRRAAFLAQASPLEVQDLLVREQTEALIAAQRRNAALLGLMIWANGTHSPFGQRSDSGC